MDVYPRKNHRKISSKQRLGGEESGHVCILWTKIPWGKQGEGGKISELEKNPLPDSSSSSNSQTSSPLPPFDQTFFSKPCLRCTIMGKPSIRQNFCFWVFGFRFSNFWFFWTFNSMPIYLMVITFVHHYHKSCAFDMCVHLSWGLQRYT